MYFEVSKREFYNALSVAPRAIPIFSSLPTFSGIKVDTKEDCPILTGNDSDVSIQTELTKPGERVLEIRDMGSIVIEAKYILKIVRRIDTDEIEFEMTDSSLTKISGNTVEFRISGMRANEYPVTGFSKPRECFMLKEETLKKVILQTSFMTSDKETRPVLTGVNFHREGSMLHRIATNFYRLAKKTIDISESLNFNITIPAKPLSEVVKTLEDEGEVEVAVNDKKAQFIIHDIIVQTRLIDGVYPEISRLVPLQFDYEPTVDSRGLLNVIDRASFIKNDGVPITEFSLSEQECVLSSKSVEVESSTEVSSSVSFTGSSLRINCNGRCVFDVIRALSSNLVTFRLCGKTKPFIVKPVDDGSAL